MPLIEQSQREVYMVTKGSRSVLRKIGLYILQSKKSNPLSASLHIFFPTYYILMLYKIYLLFSVNHISLLCLNVNDSRTEIIVLFCLLKISTE